jgi:PAS domain S-box-containing protein
MIPPVPTDPAAPQASSRAPDSDEAVLLACFPEACFSLDHEGHLTYLNPAAQTLLRQLSGEAAGPLLGRNVFQHCREFADSTFARQCKEALATRQPAESETFYPGLKRWVRVLVCPAASRLGVFLRDVTERVRLERALPREGEDLTSVEGERDVLVEQLAHQIRAALVPIRSALELAGLAKADQEVERACALAEQEVRRLDARMGALLLASRFAALAHKQRVNLTAVIAGALAGTLDVEGGVRRNLSVEVPPEPLWLEGDPTYLGQVVRQLVDAAFRLAGPSATLRLSADREGAEVVLRLAAEGAGFSAGAEQQAECEVPRRLVERLGGSMQAGREDPTRGELIVRLPAPREEAAG